MPLYDYQCGKCHHVFELKQGFNDDPVATCPQCEGEAQRLFRAVPVIFKGSGWYVNDYGKGRVSYESNGDAKSAEPAEAPASPPTGAPKPESPSASVTPPQA